MWSGRQAIGQPAKAVDREATDGMLLSDYLGVVGSSQQHQEPLAGATRCTGLHWCIGALVGALVALVGWCIGWLVHWLVGALVALVGALVGALVALVFGCIGDWLHWCLVALVIGCIGDWLHW